MLRLPKNFTALNQLVMRDLNHIISTPTFYMYSKDDIKRFLKNPYINEKNLRNAVIYVYGVSSHFRRLIQYFSCLTDLAYVISPYKIDTQTANPRTIQRNYNRVLNLVTQMNIKSQFANVVTVCLREDVFYGTMWIMPDSITIQQLPSDYCSISVIEDNVLNVSFDFSYFDVYPRYLDMYTDEFRTKYQLYKKDMTNMRWQELNSPTSFAIKCNNDILNYAIPPFVGILREIYDIEDYKNLKMTKAELENYAMLVMKLGINKEGEWDMDLDKAKDFWRNLDSVLPEEVGSVLSPMEIEKISFDKSNVGDTDATTEAEESLYTAAGVSSLLFNNSKASSNALLLSIKADQALTFGIVKSIGDAINRFIAAQSFGKNFRINFLDCSRYNRDELGSQYIKACQFGLPMISYYAATQGMSQSELDCMNFLEDNVLGFIDRFKPLRSSTTQSSADASDPGRPTLGTGELSDEGEVSRENEDGENDGI